MQIGNKPCHTFNTFKRNLIKWDSHYFYIYNIIRKITNILHLQTNQNKINLLGLDF